MSTDIGERITIPLTKVHCPCCWHRLLDTCSYGLISVRCTSCKNIITILDGEPVGEYSSEMTRGALKYQGFEPHPNPRYPSITEIVGAMEQRWRSQFKERAERKNRLAIGKRFDVFSRDGFRCVYCGRSAAEGAVLEADHKIPRSKGGTDEMDNLVTACWECNGGKSNKMLAN